MFRESPTNIFRITLSFFNNLFFKDIYSTNALVGVDLLFDLFVIIDENVGGSANSCKYRTQCAVGSFKKWVSQSIYTRLRNPTRETSCRVFRLHDN